MIRISSCRSCIATTLFALVFSFGTQLTLRAQDAPKLYVSVLQTNNFVVGPGALPSGLFTWQGDTTWQHQGWKKSRQNGMSYNPNRPNTFFLACGNGVFRTTDAGKTFKIVTSWDITEVQDVTVDSKTPTTLHIATAYGIWRSSDNGDTWQATNDQIPAMKRFMQTIHADYAQGGRVLAGGEHGIFRTVDGGTRWETVLPNVAVRDLQQSRSNPALWLAGLEDRGVWMSKDSGKTWTASSPQLAKETIYTVAVDPNNPDRWVAAGYQTGVFITTNAGKTWTKTTQGLPNLTFHGLIIDPSNGRIWAGSVGHGVFYSDDQGKQWNYAGLKGSEIWDMEIVTAQEQRIEDPYKPKQTAYHREVATRIDSVITYYTDSNGMGPLQAAARYHKGIDIDRANQMMDSLAMRQEATPSGDMFWMYPHTVAMFEGYRHMPKELLARNRNLWKIYPPYRGDTENHWAMFYASMYLMTQLYPDDPGSEWYNGRSSQENFVEARDYLYSWMDLTVTQGQGEFDSPGYYSFYMAPMAMLYAYANDPEMKVKAGMMMEYLLADFAAEQMDGMYLGAHSRVYPHTVHNQWIDNSTAFAWLYWGNTPLLHRGESLIAAFSGFYPPEMLKHIATDRSVVYEHLERKRTRHRIRYSEIKNLPVYKTMYMTPSYGLGSMQGGLLQPIQQQTWDFTYKIADVKQGFNMIYSMHPYSSGYELAMYFPEEPKLLTDAVVKSKGTYDSPDKWTGASPYEQVFQHKDALIALYNIEPGTRFPHISGFFPKGLVSREVDSSGWIFANSGSAYLAWYPLAPYTWQEEEKNWRLHSTSLKNGAVVQVAQSSEFPSFAAFKEAVKKLKLTTRLQPVPTVSFTSLKGAVMDFTYDRTPRLNGKNVDYTTWPLYKGPFVNAAVNSRSMTLTYKNQKRVLDFTKTRVTEE